MTSFLWLHHNLKATCALQSLLSDTGEESGDEALSPGTKQACETLAGIATTRVQQDDPDQDSLLDSRHKRTRQEAREALKRSCARMVKNHNKQSKVRFFNVGDPVGVKVERSDRCNVDRELTPCLVVQVNGRGQCQLRCDTGVLETLYYPDDLAPYPKDYVGKFNFSALDDLEGVPRLKHVTASKAQSYAKVSAVSCGCSSLKCCTHQCKCFASGVGCTSRCHRGKKCKHMAGH